VPKYYGFARPHAFNGVLNKDDIPVHSIDI